MSQNGGGSTWEHVAKNVKRNDESTLQSDNLVHPAHMPIRLAILGGVDLNGP